MSNQQVVPVGPVVRLDQVESVPGQKGPVGRCVGAVEVPQSVSSPTWTRSGNFSAMRRLPPRPKSVLLEAVEQVLRRWAWDVSYRMCFLTMCMASARARTRSACAGRRRSGRRAARRGPGGIASTSASRMVSKDSPLTARPRARLSVAGLVTMRSVSLSGGGRAVQGEQEVVEADPVAGALDLDACSPTPGTARAGPASPGRRVRHDGGVALERVRVVLAHAV